MLKYEFLSDRLIWAKAQKEARDAKKFAWADLARACGVSTAAVSRWINDLNGIDSGFARPLALFLGVDAVWLENGEGSPGIGEAGLDVEKAPRKKRGKTPIDPDAMVQLTSLYGQLWVENRELLIDLANDLILGQAKRAPTESTGSADNKPE